MTKSKKSNKQQTSNDKYDRKLLTPTNFSSSEELLVKGNKKKIRDFKNIP